MEASFDIKELLRKGKAGDRTAFKRIYDTYVLDMLSVSYKILNSRQDAEDVFHEAFIKSIQKLDTLSEWKSYKSWLKRIVVNDSLQRIRKKIIWEDIKDYNIPIEREDNTWYLGIPFEEINKAIEALPNGCRQVFTLYLLENYKHKEIAEFLNVSVSTSKSQYRYAIQLMKKTLTKNNLK